MQKPENLKPAEKLLPAQNSEVLSQEAGLNQQQIELLFQARKQELLSLKPLLSLKLHHQIEEKLNAEKTALFSLLKLIDQTALWRRRYSFILDPQYFEQKFLDLDY